MKKQRRSMKIWNSLVFIAKLFLKGKDTHSAIGIEVRRGCPDSDTIPLIQMATSIRPGVKIFLITTKVALTKKYIPLLSRYVEDDRLELADHRKAYLECDVIFFIHYPANYFIVRLCKLVRPNIKLYRLYHGLITKRTVAEKSRVDHKDLDKKRNSSSKLITANIAQNWIDAYRRAYSYNLTVDKMALVGFPRFYRAKNLISGGEALCLPDDIIERLPETGKIILYAPTRSGTLPDLRGYDLNVMEEWLDRNDYYLVLKSHILTKRLKSFKNTRGRIIDISKSKTVGSLDIVFRCDLLLTDTSSIMMEALSLNKPIVHAIDKKNVSLAYDMEIALPGVVVEDFNSLLDTIHGLLIKNIDNEYAKRVWRLEPERTMESAYKELIS